jgi:hypothetical protein
MVVELAFTVVVILGTSGVQWALWNLLMATVLRAFSASHTGALT